MRCVLCFDIIAFTAHIEDVSSFFLTGSSALERANLQIRDGGKIKFISYIIHINSPFLFRLLLFLNVLL